MAFHGFDVNLALLGPRFRFMTLTQARIFFLLFLPFLGAAAYAGEAPIAPGTSIEIAFPPEQDANAIIVNALRLAKHTIRVQAFSFTSNEIAFALIAAQRRGIDVQIIADAEQTQKLENSKLPLMHRAGVRIWLDAQHQSAHNKIILIDDDSARPVVITGSMNFTYSGQFKNAENVLILRGDKSVAATYAANWQRHRNHAHPYAP